MKISYYFYPMIIRQPSHLILAALLSGVLMVLSFPYTGSIPFLMAIAWIPMLIAEQYIADNGLRFHWVGFTSYLTFFTYNAGTTWWIWNASPEGAVMAIGLNSFFMSLIFVLYHYTKKRIGRTLGFVALIVYWVSFEYLHFYWELSWPWLTLGNVFAILPECVQWYSMTGILGGSVWLLTLNVLGFRFLMHRMNNSDAPDTRSGHWLLYWAVLLIVPIGISVLLYSLYPIDKGVPSEVVITQPNVDPYNEKFTGSVNDQLDKICDLADQKVSKHTDFVLAPETALPFSFYEDEIQRLIYYHYLVERKAKWNKAALLIGASTKKYFKKRHSRASRKVYGGPGYEEFYNSSLLMDEYDHPTFVHKSKLVLGVEKVPFSNWFPQLEELSINNGGTSGTLGVEDESQVMSSRGIRFAPVVCYESIYGSFVAEQCHKGAELIFIITNDGWWKDTPGYKQHKAMARLRAIENRRDIARSANTGTSCFINARGDISEETGWWKEGAARKTLHRHKDQTLYMSWGDWVGKGATVGSILALVLWLIGLIRGKKIMD